MYYLYQGLAWFCIIFSVLLLGYAVYVKFNYQKYAERFISRGQAVPNQKKAVAAMAGGALFLFVLTVVFMSIALGSKTPAPLTAMQAKKEALKIWVVIEDNSKQRAAAFMAERIDNDQFRNYITENLLNTIQQAPKINAPENAAFLPYEPCLKAAAHLYEFARLRREGAGQNDQSDAHRRPFLDNQDICKTLIQRMA